MRNCAIDIETDGFDPSKIHVLCVKEMDEGVASLGTVHQFTRPAGAEDFLHSFDNVIAHNGCGFDFPILKQLWDVEVPEWKQQDTLVLSRMEQPDRKGGHSLKSWGERLGYQKSDYKGGWSSLNDEMIKYCRNDAAVTARVYNHLAPQVSNIGTQPILAEYRMQRLVYNVEKYGFAFDLVSAYKLFSKLLKRQKEIVLEMQDIFPASIIQLKTKQKIVPFNPGSRKQIAERLQEKGWVAKEFTPTGQPRVDEHTLKGTNIPEAKILAEYFMLQKRTGLLDSWIKKSDGDRVHCSYHTLGAITHRMSCSGPNLQQVPSMRTPYGEECRKLWIADRGNVLVGADAKSLELRVLAHYMDDPVFNTEILDGDIHAANQKRAGLPTRDMAKTFIFALIYGAGDGKLGSIVGGSTTDGKDLRRKFLSSLPSFARLSKGVIKKGTSTGKLLGIDQRPIRVRHGHASLNTLIQGSSAILMKDWFTIIEHSMGMEETLGLWEKKAGIVAMVHDEVVIEAPEKEVDLVSECVKLGIQSVNKHFNLRCPLDCDVISGNNWSEIH